MSRVDPTDRPAARSAARKKIVRTTRPTDPPGASVGDAERHFNFAPPTQQDDPCPGTLANIPAGEQMFYLSGAKPPLLD